MLSDNIKAKTEYEPNSTKTKLRRVTTSRELHERTWGSNEIPVWEIPTQHSDQNSDDLATQQGSTLILSKEEKQEDKNLQEDDRNSLSTYTILL